MGMGGREEGGLRNVGDKAAESEVDFRKRAEEGVHFRWINAI